MQRQQHLHQKKSLGQVFLKVQWPLDRITEQVRAWGAVRVLEIGPGGAVLTRTLCGAGLQVTAVEKDDRFAARLAAHAERGEFAGLTVINQDILKFDLAAWIDASPLPAVVVGNIPYNISTPILSWLLPHLSRLRGVMLMVQLEFARRIVSVHNHEDYGSLSVYAQLRADVGLAFKVEKGCFSPVPKVDSAVVTLLPKASSPCPDELLRKVELVSKTAFQQRRKKLRNAISKLLGEKDGSECPIDLTRRAETLSPSEFITLTEYLFTE
jgi:16S rRNA (adenine1518-N6/adenine1519-N6)-dimethyltransferase